MVPMDEFNRLSSYYQGQMTESALLNKAGRLAADQHLILRDKSIPDSMAVNIIKPMAMEQGRLIKRVRTGTAQPDRYEGTEEPEGMVDAPVERMLKQIVKGQKPEVIVVDDDETPVKKIKRERKTPTSSVKKRSIKKSSVKKSSVKKSPVKTTSPQSKSSSKFKIPKGLSEKGKQVLTRV